MVIVWFHRGPLDYPELTACYLVATAWFFIRSPHDFSYGTPYYKTTRWTTRLHRAHHTHRMVIVWFHRGPLDYPELTVWYCMVTTYHRMLTIWSPHATSWSPHDFSYGHRMIFHTVPHTSRQPSGQLDYTELTILITWSSYGFTEDH